MTQGNIEFIEELENQVWPGQEELLRLESLQAPKDDQYLMKLNLSIYNINKRLSVVLYNENLKINRSVFAGVRMRWKLVSS